jgi:hypothetical protein
MHLVTRPTVVALQEWGVLDQQPRKVSHRPLLPWPHCQYVFGRAVRVVADA